MGLDEKVRIPFSQITYVDPMKTVPHSICYHTFDGSEITVRDTIEHALLLLGCGFMKSHHSVILSLSAFLYREGVEPLRTYFRELTSSPAVAVCMAVLVLNSVLLSDSVIFTAVSAIYVDGQPEPIDPAPAALVLPLYSFFADVFYHAFISVGIFKGYLRLLKLSIYRRKICSEFKSYLLVKVVENHNP